MSALFCGVELAAEVEREESALMAACADAAALRGSARPTPRRSRTPRDRGILSIGTTAGLTRGDVVGDRAGAVGVDPAAGRELLPELAPGALDA